MDLERNEKADEAAKSTAERSSIRRCLERFTSLVHIRLTVTKQRWKKAKH